MNTYSSANHYGDWFKGNFRMNGYYYLQLVQLDASIPTLLLADGDPAGATTNEEQTTKHDASRTTNENNFL